MEMVKNLYSSFDELYKLFLISNFYVKFQIFIETLGITL